jgi:hypothetical protein
MLSILGVYRFKKRDKSMPSLDKHTLDSTFARVKLPPEYFEVFVESETFKGDTAVLASGLFRTVYTIELDQKLHCDASNRLAEFKNVHSLFGDTLDLLPLLLPPVKEPAVFWLDGHSSGPGTSAGKVSFPVLEECAIIDKHSAGPSTLVLVDDVRLFGREDCGQTDTSLQTLTIEKVLNQFKQRKVVKSWTTGSSLAEVDRLHIFII